MIYRSIYLSRGSYCVQSRQFFETEKSLKMRGIIPVFQQTAKENIILGILLSARTHMGEQNQRQNNSRESGNQTGKTNDLNK